MPASLADKLVIAISSRALFDLSDSHRIYEEQGVEAYARYQIEHEDVVLQPGPAFMLVKKLLALNSSHNNAPVEVILLSRNSADTGLRVFNSVAFHQLAISRAAFTSGDNPWRYAHAFGAHLFLSTHAEDVVHALQQGIAAATILSPSTLSNADGDDAHADDKLLRIAFDGDAVLFSDEAERVFQSDGLDAFQSVEKEHARDPLSGGPFKNFLAALHRLQREYGVDQCPIRTALVTARSAPAHERVIRTLRAWNVRLDEMLFLGGMRKADFLLAFKADIFFDDQRGHIEAAKNVVASGHVPHGVVNQGVNES